MGEQGGLKAEHDDVASWLVYNVQHRVLICTTHGYAVPNVDGHLRERHRDIKNKARDDITGRYDGVETRGPAEMASEDWSANGPSNPRPAIEGLPMLRGFACIRCEFLTPSWKWLRVHFNEAHGTRAAGKRRELWRRVHLQTFFTGPKAAVRYFCITPAGDRSVHPLSHEPGRGGESEELMTAIKERWTQGQEEQEELQRIVAEGAAKHEITNWLKRSGWTAHFAGRDLGTIHADSRMPGPAEREGRRLAAAVGRVFFERCVGEDQHGAYLTYWKRFQCYCLKVLPLDEVTLRELHGFDFPSSQRRDLERLRRHVEDDDWPERDLEDEVLQLSASFWMQRLPGDPFESPLWHFVAVLGIDGDEMQLRPAHLFTYVLSGLVYVGRAILAEHAIPTKGRSKVSDIESRFAKVRTEWLCKATYSPMGYTLSLLLYGRKIARETGSRLMVSWSKTGDFMYFMGKPLSMEAVRDMVRDMISDAEDILWNRLMFKEGDDTRFSVPLADLEDDLTHTQRGKSFVHTNGLAGKELEMLEDLVRGKRKSEFLNANGGWRWEGIQKYQKSVRYFEELCELITQMSWGGPARGDEIGGLRLLNGINRDRSVFVVDGEVVLVTQYHKSLAHFDSPKVIPRFLAARPGQLLAMYMIYVRPLVDRWEADRWASCGGMKPPSDFIWHDENGPWEGSKISRAMSKWTYHYMGTRLTLQDWRHVAIAISKRHARQRGADKPDFDEGEDHGDDEAERYEVPDDLAAAHSTRTAASYGVTLDILKRLTADSLEVFRQVSRRWHRFLGLEQTTATTTRNAAGKRKSGLQCSPASPSRNRSKRPKSMPLAKQERGKTGPDEQILRALRAVLRDDHAQFRTPQQEEAVRMAAAKETPLVVILPTGGGKSLIFMVPAMLEGAGVTIVVAPSQH